MSMMGTLRKIHDLARDIIGATENCERASVEDTTIAWVCAQEILEIAWRAELDLIAAERA